MDKRFYAVVTILLGIVMGLIGNLFFNQKWLGLSFPLFILIALAVLFGFTHFAKSPPTRRNLWLVVPLLFFAVMVAVRSDATISVLNILAVFWLGGLMLHYWRDEKGFEQASFFEQTNSAVASSLHTAFDPFTQFAQAHGWLRENQPLRGTGVRSVGRGLLLTTPVVGVFGLLLISADSKFSELAFRIVSLIPVANGFDVFTNGFFTFGIGWLACGALAYAVLRRTSPVEKFVQTGDGEAVELEAEPEQPVDEAADAKPRKKHPFLLGMIESGIMLGSINLLFAAFVLVQFAYFFGGRQNITMGGWSYAEYARRGFFELVAVSVLTLGLILWLDWKTVRSNARQHTIFRVLSITIIAMTGVMLLSAHLRLDLYEQRDGYTHLRLFTHVFMGWLGILFVFFIVHLFRSHTQIFSLGVTICIIGYLMTMNLIDAEATIARENISRVEAGYELDIPYLFILSTDAVPVVLSYYLSLSDPDSADQRYIGDWLLRQHLLLERQRAEQTIFSVHTSRETAWQMLDAARDQLPDSLLDRYGSW